MDSRKITKISEALGKKIFVFEDGTSKPADEIAVSLFQEVQTLRLTGNKDSIAMADEILDSMRF